MTGSLAREVLRQDGLAASVDLLARSTPDRDQGAALRTAFAEYERTEDLAALERAVFADHAARLSATLASAGPAAGRCCVSDGARSTSATFSSPSACAMRWHREPKPTRRRRPRGFPAGPSRSRPSETR